jgi:deferrochelatase/peroxidase EfeB
MPPLSDEDYRDIQGLVRFGHGHLKAARFYLLTIVDPVAARAWLANVPVTSAIKDRRPDVALQVAFTYQGLRNLGASPETLVQFPYEFKSGMTEASRARRLGDIEANDPKWWLWGGPSNVPDVVVLLYATTSARLDEWETAVQDETSAAAFKPLACLPTNDIGDIEPFGFNDGLSQPVLDWEPKKSSRIHDTTSYTNVSALGEVLLGYPNEYGRYTDRPLLDPREDPESILPPAEDVPGKKDFGRNGTYLVLRDLSQDAPAFWQFVNDEAARTQEDRTMFAGSVVGRVPADIPSVPSSRAVPAAMSKYADPAGAPMASLSSDAIPGVGPDLDDVRRNQFTFHSDVEGTGCPLGAHIRRANPRNADLPEGTHGLFARLLRILGYGRNDPHEDLIASTRFHRILRRGREYVVEHTTESGKRVVRRGLRFICLNNNISRQFEFIQASWLVNPKFEGLDEGDPLVSNRVRFSTGDPTDTFTRPQASGLCRRSGGMHQFVQVHGGGYFFMPGISALRYLARVPEAARSHKRV